MPITEPAPEKSPALSEAVFVRLTEQDRRAFEAAANAEDRPLAAWLRRQGRLAVEQGERP